MHTFLPGCRVAFLGRPRQRLSPPTYWFIRGDLEPPCHMLPQMGTSPQAIQAHWQQAWNIMDAKGKREKELCQPPRQHKLCVCAFTYAHMWIIKPLRLYYVHAWFHVILCICVSLCVRPHTCVGVFGTRGQRNWAAPVYSLNAICLPGQSREKGVKLWVQGGREGRRGAISLLVTDSSMQTTFPQGKNQEGGLLTQAGREGGGSVEQCKIWPYVNVFGLGVSAEQTGQTDQHALIGLLIMSSQ